MNGTRGGTGDSGQTVACRRCRYYLVTWEPRRPYGCRAHGFKTNRIPSTVVYESSGIPCQLFAPKTPAPPKPTKTEFIG
ncbi:MAG: uracil-DNA glycosylase [Acidobacteriota bacterium]|nr:uracil-DNA glycosylase [Acidobacteriota bacterium]